MCRCSLVRSALLLNCSDAKTKPGDNSGIIPQPHPDSYARYTHETTEAYFERNRIVRLGRLSLVDINTLSLAQNNITFIDSGTFIKLKTLKALSLKSNNLTTLYNKSFHGLSNLEILDLSENILKNIYPGTFTILNSLKTLYLSHNVIDNLKEKMFAIPTLQTLDVSFNRITQIGSNVFENATNLITLNLSNNNIPAIEEHVFASLVSLQTLDLSYNQIKTVDPSALSTLKSLKWLSLSWNELEMELQDLKIEADLHVLHLAGNSLKNLGKSIRSLKLRELHVQKNSLENIAINGLQLRVLNVSSNSLASFPVVGYGALEVLDLSGNQLTTVPDRLTGLQTPALRWLSLDNNPMRQVRFPTAGKEEQDGEIFVNLTWVSVSHMKELQELGAGAFSGLASPCGECRGGAEETGVEFAALAQNCSRKLAIRVAHNPSLAKIDADAFKDVGMCSLDFSYNALSSLDERITRWESLEAVDLQGNPWDCVCPLQWVLDRVVRHMYIISQELLYELRCNTPTPLRNKRLVHFYSWKHAAFCSEMQQLRAETAPKDIDVTIGSSGAMLGVVAGVSTLVIILVITSIILQRRFNKKYMKRNRRFH